MAFGVVNRRHDLSGALGATIGVFPWAQAVSALVWAGCGWYLTTRRPGVIFGPLALVAGLAHGLAGVGLGWAVVSVLGHHHLPVTGLAFWLSGWGQAVEPAVVALVLTLFPDGRRPGGVAGWLGWVGVAVCVLGVAHAMVEPNPVRGAGGLAGLHNPLHTTVLAQVPDPVFFLFGGWLAKIGLLVRWRQATGEMRSVLRTMSVVAIGVSLATAVLIFTPGGPLLAQIGIVVLLATIVTLVLRHRIYGIEVVLNRTLVYVLLTAVVAAAYGVGVGVIVVAGGRAGGLGALVAALVAAFTVAPARQRVQRAVNRFLYGERDEPYTVVSRLAARLEAAGSAETLLADLLGALAEALRLPYAAVDLIADDRPARRIEQGTPVAVVDSFPLVHQGQPLGALVVGRRAGQGPLDARERRLLGDVARQIAVAAANLALTEALLRSRERIVNAAEEERRRLRRDLHDGLGPILTAAASKVDAAGNLLSRDPERVAALLSEVRSQLSDALSDLRRLVYALRPPALDALGLLGAVRELAARAPLPVVLDVPDSLPVLPPAVEVAAYRITAEGITNVARHAHASHCTVAISCDGQLALEIRDDGTSGGAWVPGVGLLSLRERASDLGGTWLAGPHDGGGRVRAVFPLAAPGPAG